MNRRKTSVQLLKALRRPQLTWQVEKKERGLINCARSSHLITSMHAYLCPHCGQYVYKVEMHQNSKGLFIHGTLRSTGLPIHYNTSRQTCDNYIKHNKIRGCGQVCVLPKS
jgi:hypothetical protein